MLQAFQVLQFDIGHGEASQVDVDQDQNQDQDQDLYLPEQKSPSCRDSLPPAALGSSSWHSAILGRHC